MMELLKLPNFYHEAILIFFILLSISIFYIFRPKREEISLKTKEDIYKFSIKLQKIGTSDEAKDILKKVEKYKYSKNPPKVPKSLKKEMIRIYKKERYKNLLKFFKNIKFYIRS